MPIDYYGMTDQELQRRLAQTRESGWDRFLGAIGQRGRGPLASLAGAVQSPRDLLEQELQRRVNERAIQAQDVANQQGEQNVQATYQQNVDRWRNQGASTAPSAEEEQANKLKRGGTVLAFQTALDRMGAGNVDKARRLAPSFGIKADELITQRGGEQEVGATPGSGPTYAAMDKLLVEPSSKFTSFDVPAGGKRILVNDRGEKVQEYSAEARPTAGENLFATPAEAQRAIQDAGLTDTHMPTQHVSGKWQVVPKRQSVADMLAAFLGESMGAGSTSTPGPAMTTLTGGQRGGGPPGRGAAPSTIATAAGAGPGEAPDFQSMDEVVAAYQAGKIKVGQKIRIKGVRGTFNISSKE